MKTMYVDSYKIHDNSAHVGLFVQTPVEGLESPEIRLNSYDRSGEHGGRVSNQLYGGRLITLRGQAYATTPAGYEALRRSFMSYFRIQKTSTGKPLPRSLKFTTLDDLALQVDCYTVKMPKFQRTEVTSGKFILNLYAPDFEIKAQALTASNIAVPIGGGVAYPVIYPVVYGAETGGTLIANNNGTCETYPTVVLNGPLNNPIITNTTLGRSIELNLTLTASDQIIIDMRAKTIVQNGSTNVISYISSGSRYWWLEPGANTITFRTSSTSDTGTAQLQYRDAYLGV